MLWLQLLVLLILANGAPILARNMLGSLWNAPIDGGRLLNDGQPLLGPSKTWRGCVSSTLLTSLAAALLGLGFWPGAAFGALVVCGDLLSSLIKRRLGLSSSEKATGVDQLPESVLPLLGGMLWWGYGLLTVLGVAVAFFLVEVVLSPLLFMLGIRRRPY